jgi:hypothetical protein
MEGGQMTNNILLNSTDMEPNMIQLKETGKEILTIHADGRITVSEDCKPTETAAEVLRIMRDQWLSDVQCAKIRELQSDVTQLENRLRALWDKYDGERQHYMDRIKRLEEAGDEMEQWTSEYGPIYRWRKAKEAKP